MRRLRPAVIAVAAAATLSGLHAQPAHAAGTVPDMPGYGGFARTVPCDYTSIADAAALLACEALYEDAYSWTVPADGGSAILGYDVTVSGATAAGAYTATTIALPAGATGTTVTPAVRAAAGIADFASTTVSVSAVNANGPSAPQAWGARFVPCNPDGLRAMPCAFLQSATGTGTTTWTLTALPRQYPGLPATAQVEFGWRPAGDPSAAWNVERTVAASGSAPVTATVTVPAGTPVEAGVRAVDPSGSPSGWETTTATVPGGPGAVSARGSWAPHPDCYPTVTDFASLQACEDDHTLLLAWDPPAPGAAPVTGYLVDIAPLAAGPTWTPVASLPAGTTSFQVTAAMRAAAGLAPMEDFYSSVREVTAAGTGAYAPGPNAYLPVCDSAEAIPCPYLLSLDPASPAGSWTLSAVPRQYPNATQAADVEFGWRDAASTGPLAMLGTVPAPAAGTVSFTGSFDPGAVIEFAARSVNGPAVSTWTSWTFRVPSAAGGPAASSPGSGPAPAQDAGPAPVQGADDITCVELPTVGIVRPPATNGGARLFGIQTIAADELASWDVVARSATGFARRSSAVRPAAARDIAAFARSVPDGSVVAVLGFAGFRSASDRGSHGISVLRAVRTARELLARGIDARIVVGLSRADARGYLGSALDHNRVAAVQALAWRR
jgi:hypothetical protein